MGTGVSVLVRHLRLGVSTIYPGVDAEARARAAAISAAFSAAGPTSCFRIGVSPYKLAAEDTI